MRGSQPWQVNRARVLRDGRSSAEEVFWQHIRNRQLDGFKFARQCPVGSYFADFVCREQKLIVEIDGGTHSTASEASADATREAKLAELGYRVFRVRNDEVYDNLDGVLDALLVELTNDGT